MQSILPTFQFKLFRLIYSEEEISDENINNFAEVWEELMKQTKNDKLLTTIFTIFEVDEYKILEPKLIKTNRGLIKITKENEDFVIYTLENKDLYNQNLIIDIENHIIIHEVSETNVIIVNYEKEECCLEIKLKELTFENYCSENNLIIIKDNIAFDNENNDLYKYDDNMEVVRIYPFVVE